MNETTITPPSISRASGPNPGIPLLISLLLTMASVAIGALLSGGAATGSPFTSSATVAARIHASGPALVIEGWLQVGSAIALGIGSAVVYARQRLLGLVVPGPAIGLFGGTLAAVSLLASALCTWVSGRPEIAAEAGTIHAVSFLAFAFGSTGFVAGVALLLAGIAVPGVFTRTLPRPVAVIGIVLAALATLSWFAMVIEPLQFLFPVGRFAGMTWLVVAALLLPRTRRDRDDEVVAA